MEPIASMTVVLVRPVRPENVGSACRALKNMGFSRLSLVEPAPDLSASAARNPAYGAWDVLDGARRFTSLLQAVADSHLVVATSGRLDGADVRSVGPLAIASHAVGRRVALVFGPESSGLSDAELALCHTVVRIPSAPEQPSLNLAQAVLLVCWEVRRTLFDVAAAPSGVHGLIPMDAGPRTATSGELEGCLAQWREALLDVGYASPQSPNRILGELRRLLARSEVTPRELLLLRGIARQVSWAGRTAKGQRAV